MRRLFIYTNFLFITLWCIFFFQFQFVSYTYFTNQIIHLLSIDESRRTVFLTVFSPKVFYQLKWLFLFLIIFQVTFLTISIKRPLIFKKIKECFSAIFEYPKWLWKSFKKLNKIERISLSLFMIVMIIQRLWLSSITDVIYDEAWTYLAFTSKNPLVAACFYPTSNNHILFSHLTQITKLLPFDILTNLRLSALIPNILAVITLFFCLRKYVEPLAAWVGIILFTFSFPMVYYGFVARGYSLIVLFFTVGFFSLLQILRNFENKKAWYRLLISSVLGFYTIPIYLYPFVSLFGFSMVFFWVNKNKTTVLKTVKYGLATCVLTFAVYSPVFAISGIQSVTSNKFVNSLSMKEVMSGFLTHINQTIHFFTTSNYSYIFAIALLLVFILAIKIIEFKPAIYLSIFMILMVPVLIFIHKVLPVERTWIYLLVPLIFLVSLLINNYKLSILALGLSIIYSIFVNFSWNKQMLWYDEICIEDYIQGQYFSNYFHNKKATIITSNRMNSYLKFNKVLRNEDWEIETENIDSLPPKSFYIHYIEKDSIPDIPRGVNKITSYHNYELYYTDN